MPGFIDIFKLQTLCSFPVTCAILILSNITPIASGTSPLCEQIMSAVITLIYTERCSLSVSVHIL